MRRLLKSKSAFDMPFSWIFAIMAGIVILIIAIYAASRFVSTSNYIQDSEAGKQLTILLNPIVNGITSASATKVDLNKETRIYVSCDSQSFNSPFFGRQKISFSESSGFLNKWGVPGANISLTNKYIFSNKIEQGKTIYLFSKPFYAGFRVDDLIFMSMSNYCFVSAPSIIEEEIENLRMKNINLSDNIDKCPKNYFNVCFDMELEDCNVSVYGTCNSVNCEDQYETGYSVKKGVKMNYFGSLIYATIFSSSENYECNLRRLGNKITELSSVYIDKIGIVQQKGCDSTIEPYLEQIMTLSRNLTSSKIIDIYDSIKLMNSENNDNVNCKIYNPEK